MIVCFDVDGTLINADDTPNYPVITLLFSLHLLGCKCYVWSGGGVDYAKHWVFKLGIGHAVEAVVEKSAAFQPDLAVDDETVVLGAVNFRVGGAA